MTGVMLIQAEKEWNHDIGLMARVSAKGGT